MQVVHVVKVPNSQAAILVSRCFILDDLRVIFYRTFDVSPTFRSGFRSDW